MLAAIAGIVLMSELLTPLFLTYVLAPGLDAATRGLTISLTRIMLLQQLLLDGGSVVTAVLISRRQFA